MPNAQGLMRDHVGRQYAMSEEAEVTTPIEGEAVQNEVQDVAPEGEQAEEVTSEEGEEAATSESSEEPEKPKRRSRAEERINQLTKERYEAQKQAEAFQRQLQELQMQQMQQDAKQGAGEQMPRLADFGYDEERYQAAIQEWGQSQVAKVQESWSAQQQQFEQMQKMQAEQAKLQEKVAEGQSKYPDFMQKVMDPNLPPLREINPTAFEAVMESDSSADLAYYLASNPQEVYSFASMTPVQAVRAVAKIEAQFAEKPQAKAPLSKPPSKLSGNSEAIKDPEKMTSAEWLEWRNQDIQSKRGK